MHIFNFTCTPSGTLLILISLSLCFLAISSNLTFFLGTDISFWLYSCLSYCASLSRVSYVRRCYQTSLPVPYQSQTIVTNLRTHLTNYIAFYYKICRRPTQLVINWTTLHGVRL